MGNRVFPFGRRLKKTGETIGDSLEIRCTSRRRRGDRSGTSSGDKIFLAPIAGSGGAELYKKQKAVFRGKQSFCIPPDGSGGALYCVFFSGSLRSLFLKNSCSSITETIRWTTIPKPNIKIIIVGANNFGERGNGNQQSASNKIICNPIIALFGYETDHFAARDRIYEIIRKLLPLFLWRAE